MTTVGHRNYIICKRSNHKPYWGRFDRQKIFFVAIMTEMGPFLTYGRFNLGPAWL